ncbi:MAG: hypothetical protein ABIG44_10390 [Planctomycetota bacterium]
MTLRAGISRWEVLGLIVLLALIASWATGLWSSGSPLSDSSGTAIPVNVIRELVPRPDEKPAYNFADGLDRQYPEITAFMRTFLETCLAGDYGGYRRLVSYRRDPESRDRFQAVFFSIRALIIDSVEPVSLPRLADEIYLVIGTVEFQPESKARLRQKNNRVAILVLKEDGEWRMLPAPSEFQPGAEEEPVTTTSAPTTSAPSYPWDEDGDF